MTVFGAFYARYFDFQVAFFFLRLNILGPAYRFTGVAQSYGILCTLGKNVDFKDATPSPRFWSPSVLSCSVFCEIYGFHPADQPAVPALSGQIGIDSVTVLKFQENVQKAP